jgi:hypothetical protein
MRKIEKNLLQCDQHVFDETISIHACHKCDLMHTFIAPVVCSFFASITERESGIGQRFALKR